MQDINLVIIVGEVSKAPVLRVKPSGLPKTEFTVEVERPSSPTSEKRMTDMFLVDTWDGLAEECISGLRKGDRVAVIGLLQREIFTNRDGEREHLTIIKAKFVRCLHRDVEAPLPTMEAIRQDSWTREMTADYLRCAGAVFFDKAHCLESHR
ncbi:MAG: single-stranded DNA-binding protein [Armatimonadetes bacterium]|jgi:single stranded DNA-binding protein|nr:single-stranded DNA-binding protein [Armatimonadota bacterium]